MKSEGSVFPSKEKEEESSASATKADNDNVVNNHSETKAENTTLPEEDKAQ